MKLQVKEVPEIPCLEDLSPGQLFLDTVGCVNLVVGDPSSCVGALIYWDGDAPHLASEDVAADTVVARLLKLEDLEFSD